MSKTNIFLWGLALCLPQWATAQMRENQAYPITDFFKLTEQRNPLSAPSRPAAAAANAGPTVAAPSAPLSRATALPIPVIPVTVLPVTVQPVPLSAPTAALPVAPAATQVVAPPAPSAAVSAPRLARDSAIHTWTIDLKDKTLFRTLRRWSEEANYQLFWQIDRDFPIEVEIAFNTTFLDAVHNVMKGVAMTDFPLQASFNPNSRVLRITRHLSDSPQ